MKWLSILFLVLAQSVFAAASPLIIDVRKPTEYQQEHIQGAINIEYQDIAKEISRVAPDKNAVIVLYCHSGRRAGIALEQLKSLGYTQVESAGGLEDMKKRATH